MSCQDEVAGGFVAPDRKFAAQYCAQAIQVNAIEVLLPRRHNRNVSGATRAVTRRGQSCFVKLGEEIIPDQPVKNRGSSVLLPEQGDHPSSSA
jgi:hypothetical protein